MKTTIKCIQSERGYTSVLKQMETLMDARPNSAEGDRLDVLAKLAEVWEAKHHAIEAPDPVEAMINWNDAALNGEG